MATACGLAALRGAARSLMVALAILISGLANGAVVKQMQVAELAEKAVVTFHGKVIARRSEWTEDHSSIITWVTFSVIDVFKGQAPSRLTLRFTGGTVGAMTMQLSGLKIPEVGEEGVYFLETTSGATDTPILGWNQGHFRVAKDRASNARRVYTSDWRPVFGLADLVETKQTRFSADIPSGVSTAKEPSKALGVQAFKKRLREFTGVAQ